MVSASEIRANKCAHVRARVATVKAVMLLCDSDMSLQHQSCRWIDWISEGRSQERPSRGWLWVSRLLFVSHVFYCGVDVLA